jgi:glycosyltransferase involved in cell wall biosynthesis
VKGPILLVTDELSPGGVARHVIDLANGLAERRIESIVAATDGPFRNRLHASIPFVELPLLNPNSGQKKLWGFPSSYKILKKVIQRERVTLIHSHKRYTDLLGRVLARRMSLPHISTCHNIFSSLKHFSVFGDTTIACSKAVEEMLVTKFKKDPDTVRQIYSGILPFKEYQEGEKGKILKDMLVAHGKRIIGSVGQLIASKDRATLIRAIGILKERNALGNVLFAILGEGEQKAMLEELICKEEIDDHVIFRGSMSNVEALINVAEFMVLSSVREGFPYILLEAASIGKPHIATDVGGVSEFIVDGETGILIPPSDPGKFADTIQELLDKPALVKKLGRSAREKYNKQFTYERFIDQTLEVYRPYF